MAFKLTINRRIESTGTAFSSTCSLPTPLQRNYVLSGFHLSVEKQLVLRFVRHTIGLKISRHVFVQSEVKSKPITTHSHAFSRALRLPHVITSGFDWFTVCVLCDWLEKLLWFWFCDTELKTALRSYDRNNISLFLYKKLLHINFDSNDQLQRNCNYARGFQR